MTDWAKERAALAVREVAEMGERTSPDYDAELLLVTHAELLPFIEAALVEAGKRVTDRLADPDEAMINAVEAEMKGTGCVYWHIAKVCRALAAVLETPPAEGEG